MTLFFYASHGFDTRKAHEWFVGNKNRIWVIKQSITFFFFFFSFVLRLIFLAHRGPRAEALPLALLVRNSRAGRCTSDAARSSAAHSTAIQDGGSGPCAETLASPARFGAWAAQLHPIGENSARPAQIPVNQPRPPPFTGSLCSRARAHISSFLDQRKKFSCPSNWTQSLSIGLTPGRRTLVGALLKRVGKFHWKFGNEISFLSWFPKIEEPINDSSICHIGTALSNIGISHVEWHVEVTFAPCDQWLSHST